VRTRGLAAATILAAAGLLTAAGFIGLLFAKSPLAWNWIA
jgi:hypothetical protein